MAAGIGKPDADGVEPSDLRPDTPHNLDPVDWGDFRRLAHGMLDDVISHLETIRERPVWQPAPQASRARFAEPLPVEERNLGDVLEDVRSHIMPFATGNVHPRFMGWVHGAGTPVGMIAEMVAAGLNMNCGGRDHIGLEVERQIVRWMQEAFGYPDGASGLVPDGLVDGEFPRRDRRQVSALGTETRRSGLAAAGPATRRLHLGRGTRLHRAGHGACPGLGSDNLRRIPVDASGAMSPDGLRAAIAEDRASGLLPFLVVATAGTVNTGAIDPLAEISEIASQEKLWFHVDGAIGALAVFSPALRPRLAGIETSHSIALDFHKWGHVPYDAGFLLVRDWRPAQASIFQSGRLSAAL